MARNFPRLPPALSPNTHRPTGLRGLIPCPVCGTHAAYLPQTAGHSRPGVHLAPCGLPCTRALRRGFGNRAPVHAKEWCPRCKPRNWVVKGVTSTGQVIESGDLSQELANKLVERIRRAGGSAEAFNTGEQPGDQP